MSRAASPSPTPLPAGVSVRCAPSPMSRSSFPPTIPTPAPPSLHGVLRVSSPASPVLRDAPTPCLRPAALRHLHGPYHAGLARRSQARGAPPAWVWGLVNPGAPPGIRRAERSGPPRFLDVPDAHMPRSWTPVESPRLALITTRRCSLPLL